MGRPLAGAEVVVAGAGGAAHAVVYALPDAGARRVTVANRTGNAADGARRAVRGVGAARVAVGPGRRRRSSPRSAGADLAVNATTVGMVDPGTTFPVDALPAARPSSTSSTCRPRRRCSPRPGRAACGRPTARRCSSPRRRSRSSAGPASAAWPTSCATAVAPLLADPTVAGLTDAPGHDRRTGGHGRGRRATTGVLPPPAPGRRIRAIAAGGRTPRPAPAWATPSRRRRPPARRRRRSARRSRTRARSTPSGRTTRPGRRRDRPSGR